MDPNAKRRLFARARLHFRRVRIAVWFCIFLLVSAAAYLHLIGLPDFLKHPLLSYLRDRGFEAQFSNARLGWGPDVVIDNAAFEGPGHKLAPRFSGEQAVAHFTLSDLLHGRVNVTLLQVFNGSLELPISATNGDVLFVNNVSMDVALLPNDTIRLDLSHATFRGMEIDIHGTVTNFVAARDWNQTAVTNLMGRPASTNLSALNSNSAATANGLRQFKEIADQLHFLPPSRPRLSVNIGADGRDPDSLWATLSLAAAATKSPWGAATGLRLTASCVHPMQNSPGPFLRLRLTANEVETPQSKAGNLQFTANVSRPAGSNLFAVVSLTADEPKGRWISPAPSNDVEAAHIDWDGTATLQPGSWALLAADGKLRGLRVRTRWGSADFASGACSIAASKNPAAPEMSWQLWPGFNHWTADWTAQLEKVSGAINPKIDLERIQLAGSWRAPDLVLTNLDASIFGGQFKGGIRLDAASRELSADVDLDFDPRQVSDLLTESAKKWMAPFEWDKPPEIEARARLILPESTHAAPNWWKQVLPSLQLTGDFSIGTSSYRGLQVSSAESTFTYSNEVWTLPDLHCDRPEGELLVNYTGSDDTADYLVRVESHIDPSIVRPLLPAPQQKIFNDLSFSEAPRIQGEVRGNWRDKSKTAFTASLNATNFTERGETIDSLAVTVNYSNLLARFLGGRILRGAGQFSVDEVQADFAAKKISFTNAVTTLEPAAVMRALGPLAPTWLKNLGFDTPPRVEATGSFFANDPLATDIQFSASGHDIKEGKLTAGQFVGSVHWTAKNVAVTNATGVVYGGNMAAWGVFDYAKKGTDFHGDIALSKINLPLVVRSFDDKPTKLEGLVDAHISIPGGNFSNLKSWRSTGHISISDARLWEIKIFGIFSPVLNAISPGAGDSKAYAATADFAITNGVLNTDNLEIRATGFRLVYHGDLNSDKKLDARVEALLLRDTPIIGPLFSWAFTPLNKLFEYKIGGTLEKPTYKPLYVPKFLTDFLHPFKALKSFLPSGDTNAPPPAPANGK